MPPPTRKYVQAPLTSDIMAICGSVSDWLHQCRRRGRGGGRRRPRGAGGAAPGQIATLVLPADAAWSEARGPAPRLPVAAARRRSSRAVIEQVAAALKNGKRTALLLRGRCLQARGAWKRRAASPPRRGARLLHDYFTPRLTRGEGLPEVERIPYFAEQIVEFLKGLEQIVLVGAPAPVTLLRLSRQAQLGDAGRLRSADPGGAAGR